MTTKLKNQGIIIEKEWSPKDWIFGGYTGILSNEVLALDGQWDEFLPVFEEQRTPTLETMACVSFATCNALETIIKRKWGIEYNFSDRALAKMSGTTRNGNSMSRVADTVWQKGLLYEEDWPFDRERIETWSQFYSQIPARLLDKAINFIPSIFKTNWEWVTYYNPDMLMDALKYSPLTAAVSAWGPKVNGIYQRVTWRQNHDILIYGYEYQKYWKIYDHYASEPFKKLAWNYNFGPVQKFNIILKADYMPKYYIPNNTLVFCAEGRGEMGMALDNKIIIDDLSKVMAQFIMRNNGKIEGKTKSVTQEVWDSFPKINLKNEEL